MGAVKTIYGDMPNAAKQFARDMASHNQRKQEPPARLTPASVPVEAPADPCQCSHGLSEHVDFGTHYGACRDMDCFCLWYKEGSL